MNEEHAHLTTTGDEATEARIIAWVLGEASAFEAAALEALCEQMPEWRVFQRRMLALHDCLKEAHEPSAEGDWKLSAEKRGRLDELLGKRETVADVRRKPQRMWWVNAVGIAAVLMLGFILYQGATATMGKVGHGVAMQLEKTPHVVTYSAQAPSSELSSGSFCCNRGSTDRHTCTTRNGGNFSHGCHILLCECDGGFCPGRFGSARAESRRSGSNDCIQRS